MADKDRGPRRMDRCIDCVHLVDILPRGGSEFGWSVGTCGLNWRARRAQSPACDWFVQKMSDGSLSTDKLPESIERLSGLAEHCGVKPYGWEGLRPMWDKKEEE